MKCDWYVYNNVLWVCAQLSFCSTEIHLQVIYVMKIKLFTKGSNNCRLKQLWSISDPEYLPKYEMLFMKCVVYAGLPMICKWYIIKNEPFDEWWWCFKWSGLFFICLQIMNVCVLLSSRIWLYIYDYQKAKIVKVENMKLTFISYYYYMRKGNCWHLILRLR